VSPLVDGSKATFAYLIINTERSHHFVARPRSSR
jgi:hypothetical protein